MARILELKTELSFDNLNDQSGELHPVCIYADAEFFEKFESSLLVTKALLEVGTEEYNTAEAILRGISGYMLNKADGQEFEENINMQLPESISPSFQLMPEIESRISIPFKPLNTVVTEAILFKYEELSALASAMSMAKETANEEQSIIIDEMYQNISPFMTNWEQHQNTTGTYFATNKTNPEYGKDLG